MTTYQFVVSHSAMFLYALFMLAWWKMFEKWGTPRWKALIPLYNLYIIFEKTWGDGIYFLLLFIPVINVAIEMITAIRVCKIFDCDLWFMIGMLLMPNIFSLMLAFGNYRYVGLQEPE